MSRTLFRTRPIALAQESCAGSMAKGKRQTAAAAVLGWNPPARRLSVGLFLP
jgi:hypothetical protein